MCVREGVVKGEEFDNPQPAITRSRIGITATVLPEEARWENIVRQASQKDRRLSPHRGPGGGSGILPGGNRRRGAGPEVCLDARGLRRFAGGEGR